MASKTLARYYRGTSVLHVRTVGDPSGLLDGVRGEIRWLDATLPISDLGTMHAALGFALLPARMGAGVVSSFALLALLLTAVGLYGVIAYSVSQGPRDIGIRMALGAGSADLLGLVHRKGMNLTLLGLVIGSALGFVLSPLMGSLLYGVSAMDPAACSLVLAAVALPASYFPARRAMKPDPVVVLKEEQIGRPSSVANSSTERDR